jgi:MerR family transcriptional regulator, light-induced transcriptional regulator
MSHDLYSGPTQTLSRDLERLKTLTDHSNHVDPGSSKNHLDSFASLIENVIVPRLLMVHAAHNMEDRVDHITEQTISDFIALTINENPEVAVQFVGDLLNRGVAFQSILLDLMAPAARELGARWVHDSTSFVEVTLGVARMHRILREFDGVPAHMWSQQGKGLHALLVPAPGEQHTFGLRLFQEFLLRESWAVTNRAFENISALRKLVSENNFDVIGVSLSGESLIESFLETMNCIRTHSRNKHVKVIVGGHLFAERPELITRCGADAFGADAPSSVAIVNGWARELALTN